MDVGYCAVSENPALNDVYVSDDEVNTTTETQSPLPTQQQLQPTRLPTHKPQANIGQSAMTSDGKISFN